MSTRRFMLRSVLWRQQQQVQAQHQILRRCYAAGTTFLQRSHEPFYGAPRPPSSTGKIAAVSDAWHRVSLLLEHARTALQDPTRADAVAAVGELTGSWALQDLVARMQQHPVGRVILQERPVVSKATIPYQKLLDSADNISHQDPNTVTFGQAYGKYLKAHDFDPDERDAIRYLPADSDIAYVMLRYRQCHDFFHALTGLPPTVPGELGLKWLELFQTQLPLPAFSCTFGSLQLLQNQHERHAVWNVYLPWAQRVAQNMTPAALMNVYYEKEWDTPLVTLQQRLNLEPAPEVI